MVKHTLVQRRISLDRYESITLLYSTIKRLSIEFISLDPALRIESVDIVELKRSNRIVLIIDLR